MDIKLCKFVLVVTILILSITNSVYANTSVKYNNFQNYNDEYVQTASKVWEKYFKQQAKSLKKIWAKEKYLKNDKYKLSYARVLFYVNKQGKIQTYQIKSSCYPENDIQFIASVKETIKQFNQFSTLPETYSQDLIVFTVKFNSYIPKKNNSIQNIDWNRYGMADIEISKNKYYSIIKNKEGF